MTGAFVRCVRATVCVSNHCPNKIPLGSWVYLFMHHQQQTVCVDCAKRRWNYTPPADTPLILTPQAKRIHVEGGGTVDPNFATFDRVAAGGELRKKILTRREVERANERDGKLKQAGER